MQASLKNISVLILDNEKKIAGLIRNVVVKLGFSPSLILTASDGYQGLEILRKRPVDLIITDWELLPVKEYLEIAQNSVIRSEHGDFPPTNGANFVKCLRHSPLSPNPYIPVIMLTGPTLPNHILYARDAGVNEILMKPIIAEDLAKRIVTVIEQPRDFITCKTYKGPCRRRKSTPLPPGKEDRRKHELKIIRHTPGGVHG